jgi:hypothetical protein
MAKFMRALVSGEESASRFFYPWRRWSFLMIGLTAMSAFAAYRIWHRSVSIAIVVGAGIVVVIVGEPYFIPAFCLATVVGGVALWSPRVGAWTVGGLGLVALFGGPWVFDWAEPAFDLSRGHQERWREAVTLAHDNPFFGSGFTAYRAVSATRSTHPFNLFLQLWIEIGLVGVTLAAVAFFLIVRRAATLADHGLAACALATLAGFMTAWAFTFGAWQGWLLISGWFLCAATCSLERPRHDDDQ